MNKKRIIAALILSAVLVYNYYIDQKTDTTSKRNEENQVKKKKGYYTFDFLPSSTTKQIIKHNHFSLSYSEKHEQAEWVAYSLHKNDIVYTNFKRPFFIEDPKVRTKSADWRNYKHSGYDRGHLCPAADRKSSKEAFEETFYTSNISPQKHEFNSGIWNKLEQKVRYWAEKYNHLYVFTGGVLTDSNLKSIGKEKVTIPKFFYKVLLDYTDPEIKAIAFLLPHKESNKPLSNFVISIDELEQKTGIDFFKELPDNIEDKLESSTNYKNWWFR
ncbi:endonuclease [Tenacibaculum sp. SZ-18]|uniref:DNA/RNA non-specific endonuclease n=1 Tax=Tenacibaculum sp. SZ-18 TaxID=754423 RepID=UPI000C2D381A|nr:DNA/RNA non-specific endonuclease [Tenacibaculum sp. SZ-18]AUC14026.1 endonuclease [Tenacibaculum sp. SZ-18]